MIKRYNQFLKEDIYNPGFDEEEGDYSTELGDDLGFDEEEGDYQMNDELPIENDFEEDEQMEEEEGGDIYKSKMEELASLLGEPVRDGKIMYQGKKIIFPSETEMYHVNSKKFKTVEEVVDYLKGGSNKNEEDKRLEFEADREADLMDEDERWAKAEEEGSLLGESRKFNKGTKR